MKKITTLLLIATLVFTISCNNADKTEAITETTVSETSSTEIADKNYEVSTSESVLKWIGYGVGTKNHFGNVNISEGEFGVQNGKLASGKLLLDMTTISSVDLTDPEKKGNLEGHLKDTDFFNSAEHPIASIEITDASNMDAVKGNLTIKGITNEVVFPAKLENVNDKVQLTADLSVDRTKYDITFRSGNFFKDLGDKLINDEFKIAVVLFAK